MALLPVKRRALLEHPHELSKIRRVRHALQHQMKVVGHEAVRNYRNVGILRSTRKLRTHRSNRRFADKDTIATFDTYRHGIPIPTEIIEAAKTRGKFDGHDTHEARALPCQADLKVRLYDRAA